MFRNSIKLLVMCCVASGAHAQLDPPVGPIVKTGKLLIELEPRIAVNATNTPGDVDNLFIISQPGSYYLTGNISAPLFSTKNGIKISTANVTLDLMGFTLKGVPTSGFGVVTNTSGSAQTGIVIRNGKVDSWGSFGVYLAYSPVKGAIVEGIQTTGCTNTSIVGSDSGIIKDCTARFNNSTGIEASENSIVKDCTASLNGGNGISLRDGSTASNCTSSQNGSAGFFLYGNVTLTDSKAVFNAEDGIRVSSRCKVKNNTSIFNGNNGLGAGIYLSSFNNAVEENTCWANDVGINAMGTRNSIFSNTCYSNTTNYLFVADNIYGPIIDRSTVSTAAVSGNSAPDTSGSTHPRANFAY